MARMSLLTSDPSSSSSIPKKMGDGAVVSRSRSNFVCKLAALAAAPPAAGSVLWEMQRQHKLAAAAATLLAVALLSMAAEVSSGASVGATTALIETNNCAQGMGVKEGRNVVGANEPNINKVLRGNESATEDSV